MVVDDEQGIDFLADALYTVECFVDLELLLKEEGDGDDADGENALGHGLSCDDGGGTCAGASAHAGGDEHHVEVVFEGFADGLDVFFGQLPSAFGTSAGAESRAELHVLGHERGCQRLGVGIANEEANPFDVLAIHVADGVAAAAADTDDFDDGYGSLGLFGGSELNDGLEVFLFVGLGGVIRHGVGFVPNRRWMLGVG